MHAAQHAEWMHDRVAAPRARVVPFPVLEDSDPWPADRFHRRDEQRPARRRRTRQAARSDALPRLVITGLAIVTTAVVVLFLMVQLRQVAQRSGAPAPTSVAIGQPNAAPAANQPPAGEPTTPAFPPGQGPLRVTSRVVEPGYTVTSGDTLGTIATRFGTTVEALQAINNLADREMLSIGQKLVIPNQQ